MVRIKCDIVQQIVCGETHGEDSPTPSLFQGQFTEWLWIKCDIVQHFVCGETHGEDSHPPPYSKDKSLNG